MIKTNEQNDPLLAALNGETVSDMPPYVDAPGAAAPSRTQELTVNVAPRALTPVEAADAQHATKSGGKGFRVRVRGEYYAPNPDGKGKAKKPYEVTCNVRELEGCLSVIKRQLLKPALRAKYSDFAADRTCYIVDTAPLDPATPKSNNLAYMDRNQLEDYLRAQAPKIPIDVSTYPSSTDGTTALREAIIDYTQTPNGFAEREAERQSKRVLSSELAELNPGLEIGG